MQEKDLQTIVFSSLDQPSFWGKVAIKSSLIQQDCPEHHVLFDKNGIRVMINMLEIVMVSSEKSNSPQKTILKKYTMLLNYRLFR